MVNKSAVSKQADAKKPQPARVSPDRRPIGSRLFADKSIGIIKSATQTNVSVGSDGAPRRSVA
jgi:hypothetical protein